MKFNIMMYDERIHEAAKLVEAHYCDDAFVARIVSYPGKFNLTTHTNTIIAFDIVTSGNIEMTIKPYKTWSPWSKVIGYASGKTIYVNTRKLDLSLRDRVANFMHEPLHLLGYSHKGNTVTEFNKNTVPYKVAEIFVKYLESIEKL